MSAPRNAAMTVPVGSRVPPPLKLRRTSPRDRAKKAWPMVRLGEVCEEIRERIPSSKIQLPYYITTDNMVKGCGGVRLAESVPDGVGLVRYKMGDVLLSNIRPYLKKAWLADREGGCSSDVIVFRSLRNDLSSEYLYRVLSQDGFFDYSMQNVSGTKMPRGKRDWIKAFQFPLPPLSIQREIVARLEKELGEAEKLAVKFKRVAELADEAFKAELDETFRAVEKECDSRVEHVERVEGASDVLAAKNAKSAKPRRVRLGEVCETINVGIVVKPTRYYIAAEFGIPAFRNLNVKQSFVDESEWVYVSASAGKENPRSVVKMGDVLIARSGVPGAAVAIDSLKYSGRVAIDILVAVPKRTVVESKYLAWQINSSDNQEEIRKMNNGVALTHVGVKSISKLKILLPSLPAQRAIVAKLDAAKERCEKLKAAALRGLAAAENLRKAILAEAFDTGDKETAA